MAYVIATVPTRGSSGVLRAYQRPSRTRAARGLLGVALFLRLYEWLATEWRTPCNSTPSSIRLTPCLGLDILFLCSSCLGDRLSPS